MAGDKKRKGASGKKGAKKSAAKGSKKIPKKSAASKKGPRKAAAIKDLKQKGAPKRKTAAAKAGTKKTGTQSAGTKKGAKGTGVKKPTARKAPTKAPAKTPPRSSEKATGRAPTEAAADAALRATSAQAAAPEGTRRPKKHTPKTRRPAYAKFKGNLGKHPKPVGTRRPAARTSSARREDEGSTLVRLNKYLADHGVASRRACDDLIVEGKVIVDGMPATELGTKVDPTTQHIEVDGVVLRPEHASRRYYVLNKPPGVVCTNDASENRPRAIDLITDPRKGRIYTVGRLDEESKGLILLTNDGQFGQRVAHPRHGVSKTYRVRVQGRIDDDSVQKVRDGVHLAEGRTGGARIVVKRRSPSFTILEVTIREGMNRELRRSFARVGHSVLELERTHIGPLGARGLRVGRWRELSREEVEALLEASTPREPGAEGRGRRPAGRQGGFGGGGGKRGKDRSGGRAWGEKRGSRKGNAPGGRRGPRSQGRGGSR